MSTKSDTLELARRLIDEVGVSQSFASQLATGKRSPSLRLAVKIETATGIPPGFWIDRPDLSHGANAEGTLNAADLSGVAV